MVINHLSDDRELMPDSSYEDHQAMHDREYAEAWANASPQFRERAERLGIEMERPSYETMAMPFDPGYDSRKTPFDGDYHSGAYTPDMADLLDTHVDNVIEKYGSEHATLIRAIASELKKPMEEELVRNRALLLGRVACYLISDEKGNIKARIHALLHSIPRLAAAAGYVSMRASAKHCHVSPEWLRRTRDKWCNILGIEIPAEGRKSEEAKAKYKLNGVTNHWRSQKFVATPI